MDAADSLAAADKLDDFDLCTRVENRGGPVWLLHDTAVQFDGHARGIKIQLAKKTEDRLALWDRLWLAVHRDLNGHIG